MITSLHMPSANWKNINDWPHSPSIGVTLIQWKVQNQARLSTSVPLVTSAKNTLAWVFTNKSTFSNNAIHCLRLLFYLLHTMYQHMSVALLLPTTTVGHSFLPMSATYIINSKHLETLDTWISRSTTICSWAPFAQPPQSNTSKCPPTHVSSLMHLLDPLPGFYNPINA